MWKSFNESSWTRVFSWSWLLVLLVVLPVAAGEPAEILVRSLYRSPLPGAAEREISWRFIPSAVSSGGRMYEVRDREGRVGTWGRLVFDAAGRMTELKRFRLVRGETVLDETHPRAVGEPLILVDGLPPLDWFNCSLENPGEKHRELAVERRAGPARFVTRYTVGCREIGFAEAEKRGMLDAGNRKLARGRRLYLKEAYPVSEPQEKPVLLQLWCEGDDFWLYEEKGARRSWRYKQ